MPHRLRLVNARLAAVLGLLAASACAPVEEAVREIFDNRTPRERYQDALVAAGLGNSALVRDTSGNHLYYAHLDRWNVHEGAQVRTGDTVGFVGNTGNARTTPPHLHFGIYWRGSGPMDPYWFVHQPPRSAPALVADTNAFGTFTRGVQRGLVVRAAPSVKADTTAVLGMESEARIYGASANWYRVRMENGMTGYVQASKQGRTAMPR